MKIQCIVTTSLLLLCLASCSSDPHAYDRYDQTQGQAPGQMPGRANPNSYPQTPSQPYPAQPYRQAPYIPPQPYQQTPYAQPPYQQNPYGQYPQQGGSRYYSNPYATPPNPYYGYDADQYYVPPTNYGSDNQQIIMEKR